MKAAQSWARKGAQLGLTIEKAAGAFAAWRPFAAASAAWPFAAFAASASGPEQT